MLRACAAYTHVLCVCSWALGFDRHSEQILAGTCGSSKAVLLLLYVTYVTMHAFERAAAATVEWMTGCCLSA